MGRPRRGHVALALSILAALMAVAAVVAIYLRAEIADRDAFADRAVAALDEPAVRQVASREIVVGLLERGSPDLVSARPLLESAVGAVVGTAPFQALVRRAAQQGHHLLFERGNAFVLDLADTGTVVLSAVRSLAPDVASRLPAGADATLIDLRERPFATDTLAAADQVRRLAIVLPILALALLAGAVWLAPDRSRALTGFGLAVGVAATVAEIALTTARTLVLRGLDGTATIPAGELRAAGGGVWDAFLGDLAGLLLIVAVVGFVLAAGVLSAVDPEAVRRQLARVTRRPQAPWALGARGLAIAAAGVAVLLEPDLALRIVAYVLGAALVYAGSVELLTALGRTGLKRRPEPESGPPARRRRLAVAGVTAALTLGLASGAAALVLHEEAKVRAQAAPASGCNGLESLCSRRLNEVVFPGTHNAMGAADVAGWSLPNQRRSIERQLDDGIRLFLLDPHYGRALNGGRVQTDFAGEGRSANKVARELDDTALEALDRLGLSITRSSAEARGPREVWLCHTVCELGATRMSDALATFRTYLDAHPSTVVVLILENYVTDANLRKEFAAAGLEREAIRLGHDEPLPTLGEMLADDRHLVVFTEKATTGAVPWLNDAFSWIQDTPLGAQQPDQLRCKRFRGEANSPFLMLNHWIDRFPPPVSANAKILAPAFLRERVAACEQARGLPVSLIATDFYETGDLIGVAKELNARPLAAPATP